MPDLLDEVFQVLQTGAERIGRDLGAGGDWHPMLGVAHRGRGAIIPVPVGFLDSGKTKDSLAAIIRGAFANANPEAIALLTSAWTLDIENATDEQRAYALKLASENRLTDHPRKVEMLSINGCNAERAIMRSRKIVRDRAHKPTLVGEWKEVTDGPLSGRFAEALADAVGYEIPNLDKMHERVDEILRDE